MVKSDAYSIFTFYWNFTCSIHDLKPLGFQSSKLSEDTVCHRLKTSVFPSIFFKQKHFKCLHVLEGEFFGGGLFFGIVRRHQASEARGGEEKEAETQGSSGKFYINHYKLDSLRMWLFGSKSLSLGVETSTWLSHHSFLEVGLSGKS